MSIPVTRLDESAREALRRHFLSLAAEDVRLRFGSALAPAGIEQYVAEIDFDRDAVLGAHDEELELAGAAHVAFTGDMAELGISVLPGHRGRGVGGALLARAVEHARNRFVDRLYMHCLAENATMMHLARKLGMRICVDTGEAEAFLTLPPPDPASVAGEFVQQRFALFDYALKAEAASLRRIADALRPEPEAKR
ncbi:MAG TPA: GNAT family N-acetyltransferase [Casimicrobiaceae bacterium]|nr:GNAT family N-acetyltransferase [Casimicrobiaceae bacterium]